MENESTTYSDQEKSEDEDEDTFEVEYKQSETTLKTKIPQMIDPNLVDSFYLQRIMTQNFTDVLDAQERARKCFEILSSSLDAKECENELVSLFDYEKFNIVKMLTINRDIIVWCTRLSTCESDTEKVRYFELLFYPSSLKCKVKCVPLDSVT